MSAPVFLVVLLAAALHAGWNAIVKHDDDPELGMVGVATAACLIAVSVLPWLDQPAHASWPFLAASGLVHTAYFALIAGSYRVADMSQAYPLMRGTAPLIVAVAGAALLGDHLPHAAWLGIGLICAGNIAMAADARAGRGLGLALLNAGVIAAYTLLDGEGVRRADATAAYVLWVFLLSGVPLVAIVAARRGAAVGAAVRHRRAAALVGGAGTLAAYILVLWAMTRAPVALVAALRETAILFGLAISALRLDERVGPARIAAAGMIALGAAALQLA